MHCNLIYFWYEKKKKIDVKEKEQAKNSTLLILHEILTYRAISKHNSNVTFSRLDCQQGVPE